MSIEVRPTHVAQQTLREGSVFKSSGEFETSTTGTTANSKSLGEKQTGNNISEKLTSCRVEF